MQISGTKLLRTRGWNLKSSSQYDIQGAQKAPVIAGKAATVQLLQPKEIQALGNDVAASRRPRRRRPEKYPVKAVPAGGPDAEVGVPLRVPRVLAVLGFPQKLPDI